jgi:hypothetical protein
MSQPPAPGPGLGDEPVPGSLPPGGGALVPEGSLRLTDFAAGGAGDACLPGPGLAVALAALSGPDWRCAGASDDDKGKVHVNKDETATRHGAWGGAAAGAVIGILFPPSIIGTAIVGAAVGGVSGHLWRGMSRNDVKELDVSPKELDEAVREAAGQVR